MYKGNKINKKALFFLLIMIFSLSVKTFHVHNSHHNHFGIKHCTICQYTIIATLDNKPLSIEKPLLEQNNNEEFIFIISTPIIAVTSTKQLRAPPIS